MQFVQLHKAVHLGSLEVASYESVYRPVLERECKPVQLSVCQLKRVVALVHLMLPALLPLRGGVSPDAPVLEAPKVAWSLMLVTMVPVRVTVKHRLMDAPPRPAWYFAVHW